MNTVENSTQETTIFGIVRQEVNDFINNYIEVVPGFNFSQYQTIKRNHLYVNSRFYDQSLFAGREKLFFNITTFRKDTAKYLIGLDTKNGRLVPKEGANEWATNLLQSEIHLNDKETRMPKKFNDAADKMVTHGSVVIKKTKDGPQIVDLRRLFLDPTVETITDSRFIIIKHYMTPEKLRSQAKKNGWDMQKVKEIIEKKKGQKSFAPQSYENFGYKNPIVSTPYIEIYERYGEVEANKLDMTGDPVRSLFIVAEPFAIGRSQDGKYEWDEGNVLFKSKWTGPYPFKDAHYRKTEGRWLGIGVVEELYPMQERFNEMANQKRVAMEIEALNLFQTHDATIVNNILTDLQPGDVIKTRLENALKPLANEMRNLSAFEMEDTVYNALSDKISFVNDIVSGRVTNSSLPATNAAIANTNSKSFFRERRQDFAFMWREIYEEWILPQAVKDLSVEHVLAFTGSFEELQKFDEDATQYLLNNAIFDYVQAKGYLPDPNDIEKVKATAMQGMKKKGKTRIVHILENMYKYLPLKYDFVLDDESEDAQILANNKFQLLTAIAQNPGLLTDPVTKVMIYDYAESTGINPIKLEVAETQRQQQLPQQQIQSLQGQLQLNPQLNEQGSPTKISQ